MEEKESEQFIIKSVSLAIQRDGNSSGIIRICKISKKGIFKKAIVPSKIFC